MTDKPKLELADAVKIHACEAGHVHVTFMREDGTDIATAIFEIEEAIMHARATVRMALAAGGSRESAPGIVDGDVEKHTKH